MLGLPLVFGREPHIVSVDVAKKTVVTPQDLERAAFKRQINGFGKVVAYLVIPHAVIKDAELRPMPGASIRYADSVPSYDSVDMIQLFPALAGKFDRHKDEEVLDPASSDNVSKRC